MDERRRRGDRTTKPRDPTRAADEPAGEGPLEPSDTEAERPAKGKWLDEVRTTVWDGATLSDQPEEPEPPKRQTAPYLSQSRAHAATPRPTSPMDVAAPRPVTISVRAEPAAAPAARRPTRAPVEPAVARIVAPAPEQEEEEELDRRPTGGYASVEREPLPRAPLMIEAPLQIKERVVEQISPDPGLHLLTEPGSRIAEQYRVLALKLRELSYLRVVALVPPAASKDQGLAASNVALAFAEGGRNRVLLIDANLRRPVLHELFGLQPGWAGFAEQVRQHRRSPRDPWHALGLTGNLALMPAGPEIERNPSAVLSADPVAELFAEARRSYDMIVVSPPPVLESADVNILQDHVDGAVLVVCAGVTRRDSVTASLGRLSAKKFLGAVLTNAR